MQVENAHVKLIRGLHMSRAQQADMAACWNAWLKQRIAQNSFTSSCHTLLDTLPGTLPIPRHRLHHIAQLASGTAATGVAARLCLACTQNHHGARMHESGACACGGAVERGCGAGSMDACAGCGGAVGSGEVEQPLGADAEGMCRAAEALRVLWRMQESDTDIAVALLALQQQPGALLGATQLARVCRTNLEERGPVYDTLLLCQMAAMQVRREGLLRWPAVLGKPLPERM